MRKVALLVITLALGAIAVTMTSAAFADHNDDRGGRNFKTGLDGWAEVPSQVTTGHGDFQLRIVSPVLWEFKLRYEDMEGPVFMAHIHVGSHHENGGVSAWLCGGSTQPPCPPGPDGELEWTIEPSDVTGPVTQGVEPANMADLLRAIREGETYVNVHTTRSAPGEPERAPGGEIRGQLKDRHNHGDRHGHGHGHND